MDIETDCPPPTTQPTCSGATYTNGYIPGRIYNSMSTWSTRQTGELLQNSYENSSRLTYQHTESDVLNYRTQCPGTSSVENSRTNVLTSLQNCDNSNGYNFSARNSSSNFQNDWNNSLNLNIDSGLPSLENLSLNETSSSIVFNRPAIHISNHQNRIQQLRNSKYPNYRTIPQRLQTFAVLSIPLVQSPNTMSEAGFFALSDQDFVRCFHCGIGLRNWEEDDDPYVEHCRWSPNCQYMKLVKGQAFINAVQDAVRKVQLEEALEQSETRDGGSAYGSVTYTDVAEDGDNNESYPQKVLQKNPLLCNAAQSVIEMGYLPRVVKKAVDSVIQTHGLEGLTAVRISEHVFEMEEKGERVRIPSHQVTQKHTEKSKFSEEAKKKLEQQNREIREKILCVICCEADRAITFLPCGHLVCCAQCAPACNSCAVCRKEIKGTVKVSLR